METLSLSHLGTVFDPKCNHMLNKLWPVLPLLHMQLQSSHAMS